LYFLIGCSILHLFNFELLELDGYIQRKPVIMPTSLLYISNIFIWGSTWIFLKLQLGVVSVEMSVAYRFILAGCILLVWCLWTKKSLKYTLKDHFFIFLQGLTMFSVNYYMAYFATYYITSGLNSVVFSSLIIFNIFNSLFFFNKQITLRVMIGAIVGIIGLCLVFLPEFTNIDLNQETITGLSISLGGAVLASFGNMVAARNQMHNLAITPTNTLGMLYGGFLSLLIALCLGREIIFDLSIAYVGSLAYLAIFGSVVAFGCYLTLLKRIGPDKVAYPMVLVPIVALLISEIFEDFTWSLEALFGVSLILVGNALVIGGEKNLIIEKIKGYYYAVSK